MCYSSALRRGPTSGLRSLPVRFRNREEGDASSMIKVPDVTLLYVMFAFVASYAILKRFLFVPLGAILAEREQEEREASRIHQESLKELERTIAEAERRLAEARREALRERETLRGEGLRKFEGQLAQARQAALASIEAASAEIGAEVRKAAAELLTRAPALAVLLAEKILGRKLAA